MKKLEYTITDRNIRNELEGLAYWIANKYYIVERFGNDDPEVMKAHNTIIDLFNNLDTMGVPYWVQNTVIVFAEDWRQYKEIYLDSFLRSKNIFFEI